MTENCGPKTVEIVFVFENNEKLKVPPFKKKKQEKIYMLILYIGFYIALNWIPHVLLRKCLIFFIIFNNKKEREKDL